MPKVAIVIPARFASTRLPGKPLLLLQGKPLIQHVWERAVRASGVAKVLVATDDARIVSAVARFGGEAVLTSRRHRSGTDRAAEALAGLRGITHVINVQGDEPLVDPALIARLATTMAADPRVEMVTAATKLCAEEDFPNPNVVKVVLAANGDALYFSRSGIPCVREGGRIPTFFRHVGIYGYRAGFLRKFVAWKPGPLELAECLEQLRALENGARIRVLLARKAAAGVDTPADLAAMEKLVRR